MTCTASRCDTKGSSKLVEAPTGARLAATIAGPRFVTRSPVFRTCNRDRCERGGRLRPGGGVPRHLTLRDGPRRGTAPFAPDVRFTVAESEMRAGAQQGVTKPSCRWFGHRRGVRRRPSARGLLRWSGEPRAGTSQPAPAPRARRHGPFLRRAARHPHPGRGSPTCRRRTSSGRSGPRSARRRTATCSGGGSSGRCSCSGTATAASPTSATRSGSPASARSAGRSATSSAAPRRSSGSGARAASAPTCFSMAWTRPSSFGEARATR